MSLVGRPLRRLLWRVRQVTDVQGVFVCIVVLVGKEKHLTESAFQSALVMKLLVTNNNMVSQRLVGALWHQLQLRLLRSYRKLGHLTAVMGCLNLHLVYRHRALILRF